MQVKERRRVIVRFAGDSGDGMQLAGSRFMDATAEHGNDFATLQFHPEAAPGPHDALPFFDRIATACLRGSLRHAARAVGMTQ